MRIGWLKSTANQVPITRNLWKMCVWFLLPYVFCYITYTITRNEIRIPKSALDWFQTHRLLTVWKRHKSYTTQREYQEGCTAVIYYCKCTTTNRSFPNLKKGSTDAYHVCKLVHLHSVSVGLRVGVVCVHKHLVSSPDGLTTEFHVVAVVLLSVLLLPEVPFLLPFKAVHKSADEQHHNSHSLHVAWTETLAKRCTHSLEDSTGRANTAR